MDAPAPDVPDTPLALPERHLNKFFQSLKIPYRAFEAENPKAVADAIAEIDKLERNPIHYSRAHSRARPDSGLAYADRPRWRLLLLLLAKLAEVRLRAPVQLERRALGKRSSVKREARHLKAGCVTPWIAA